MADTNPVELSVVLPGFNEVEGLGAAVDCYRESLPACGIGSFELIIVDDGSRDGMGDLADRLAAEDPRIRVFHFERNRGMMAAVLHGFEQARGAVVSYNGVDLPFHPADSGKILETIRSGADVVVVERTHRRSYGPLRKIISWSNVLILRVLFGSPFRDHNFVQFFRREALAALSVQSRGVSTFSAELIFRSLHKGFRVVAVPGEYHERRTGKSTITPGRVLHTMWETLRLWWLLPRR